MAPHLPEYSTLLYVESFSANPVANSSAPPMHMAKLTLQAMGEEKKFHHVGKNPYIGIHLCFTFRGHETTSEKTRLTFGYLYIYNGLGITAAGTPYFFFYILPLAKVTYHI